jgi:hypothetical protein|nr:hypothetical protein [uncultured Lachnoanaerobaculum sp.]
MDIENMQNQLFSERSDEFLKEFHMKKDEYEQCIFKDLEELLGEKNAKYIVISPLYSSFVTHSYEYRLGVYGKDLYLSNLDKSIYWELPLMKKYITEDFASIDKYMLNNSEIEKVTDFQKKDIKYQYSLRYLMTGRQIWRELIECFVEHINKKNVYTLNDFNIVYGLYMERGEHFFSGNII